MAMARAGTRASNRGQFQWARARSTGPIRLGLVDMARLGSG